MRIFAKQKKSRLYFDIKNDIENGSLLSMASYLLAVNNIANELGESKFFKKSYHFAIYSKQKECEQFKPKLQTLQGNELSCLLEKISLYLVEYLGEGVLKELNMAFKSIGQKYGFVSAGDVYRQRIADARTEEQAKAQKQIAEERQKAEEEHAKAENAEAELVQTRADTEVVLREMGMSDEKIAEMQAKLEVLRQSRLSHG